MSEKTPEQALVDFYEGRITIIVAHYGKNGKSLGDYPDDLTPSRILIKDKDGRIETVQELFDKANEAAGKVFTPEEHQRSLDMARKNLESVFRNLDPLLHPELPHNPRTLPPMIDVKDNSLARS